MITRLSTGISKSDDEPFYQRFNELVNLATRSCTPFRKHRHKRLAHSDLDTKLQRVDSPLPGLSIADIESAITSLQSVLNAFSQHFFDQETVFKVMDHGSVKALVMFLKKGVDALKAEEAEALARHGLTSGCT